MRSIHQDDRAPEGLLRDLVENRPQGARKVLVEALKVEYKFISKLSAWAFMPPY